MWNKRAESRVWNEMAAILILVHDAEIIIEERARVRSYTTMIHVLVLSIDDSILYFQNTIIPMGIDYYTRTVLTTYIIKRLVAASVHGVGTSIARTCMLHELPYGALRGYNQPAMDCPMCIELMASALTLACGHSCCKLCLVEWVQTKPRRNAQFAAQRPLPILSPYCPSGGATASRGVGGAGRT
jgi:hypothetical protein